MSSDQKFKKNRQEEAKKRAAKKLENKKKEFKKLEILHFTDKRNISKV